MALHHELVTQRFFAVHQLQHVVQLGCGEDRAIRDRPRSVGDVTDHRNIDDRGLPQDHLLNEGATTNSLLPAVY